MVVRLTQPSILADPAALTEFLTWVIVAMALSLVLQFLIVVTKKLRVEREHAAEDAAFQQYTQALQAGVDARALVVDPAAAPQRRALGHALAASPAAAQDVELREASWFAPLMDAVLRETRHRHWGTRASAYEFLGLLPGMQQRPMLSAAAIRERHPRAYAACLQALACKSRSDDEIAELCGLLRNRHVLSGSFNVGIFRMLIDGVLTDGDGSAATTRLETLLHALADTPLLLMDAIAAIGRAGAMALVPAIAALAQQPAARVALRIACTRAIGQLAPRHPALLSALDDPSWQVQATAARAVRGTDATCLDLLTRLLTHASFYVRRNAALTLLELGEAGILRLRVMSESDDAYAANMARFALAAGESARA